MRVIAMRLLLASAVAAPTNALAMTLKEAIDTAVQTNPQIGEAAANKRATEFQIRQVQSGLLPQVRGTAGEGLERFHLYGVPNISGTNLWGQPVASVTNKWHNAVEGSLSIRQLLYDGFATTNEIYRQMHRSQAASWRTFERSELVALDTVQAYLDIVRLNESIGHANRSLAVHHELLANVRARFSGGRAGVGDVEQVQERVSSIEATIADFKIKLEEAKAAFRKSVGAEPKALSQPVRLAGLPRSRNDALDQALRGNPTIQAAKSDVDATESQYEGAKGAYGPSIYFQSNSSLGKDSSRIAGRFGEQTAKLTATWDFYKGGADAATRHELAERVGQAKMAMSVTQRAAFQSIDAAWGARTNIDTRIAALAKELKSERNVISAYRAEYELGQRTLLDLLNSESSLLSIEVSLSSARTVAVYADFQLLAAAGSLLSHLHIEKPLEGRPLIDPVDRSVLPSDPFLADPELKFDR